MPPCIHPRDAFKWTKKSPACSCRRRIFHYLPSAHYTSFKKTKVSEVLGSGVRVLLKKSRSFSFYTALPNISAHSIAWIKASSQLARLLDYFGRVGFAKLTCLVGGSQEIIRTCSPLAYFLNRWRRVVQEIDDLFLCLLRIRWDAMKETEKRNGNNVSIRWYTTYLATIIQRLHKIQ